MTVTRIRR